MTRSSARSLLWTRALAWSSACLLPLAACSVDDRQLRLAELSGGGADGGVGATSFGGAATQSMAGGNSGRGGQSGQNTPDASSLDATADAADGSTQPPIPTIDGCPDLDTDSVSDCQETQVVNPEFDRDTSGWTTQTGATLSWDPADALSSDSSGSALLVASGSLDTTGSGLTVASQCIAISGKQLVIAYANTFIDAGQDSDGQASLHVAFYDAAECAGTISSEFTTPPPTDAAPGIWLTVQAGSVSGDATKSARVDLALVKPFRDASFRAHFDDILVKVRPPN